MQIYGYPGKRIDFVSKSASAGSIMGGDSRALVEEFFGPAHTSTQVSATEEELGYFSQSIMLLLADAKVVQVSIHPQRSQLERVDVYLEKTRLSGLDAAALKETASCIEGVTVEADAEGLSEVTFRL
ncbi:hypothetical protein GWO53_07235 [Corynebacterium macginleyi]|uniref:Uncharacterized protein n=1 Tax=Corynebacterium macginleyi TaxID=38290 RepID=A0A3M0G223_9CORY|nr:hypothetical protein [Corynebacterium macginleyi]MBK4138228.1 hypothetical protein [Corynebacterium macginleyi]MBK4140254.1 hypothetical protein [Corynebacterium macginleyi]MBK4142293.1 hypothetical protein [Corynebacterium macginleyi]MBK4144743.1 hypothetical protein [Corynebacterium macginleyi]MBK4147041.1 hypothetical protein [Corynebacterium macginleyi]